MSNYRKQITMKLYDNPKLYKARSRYHNSTNDRIAFVFMNFDGRKDLSDIFYSNLSHGVILPKNKTAFVYVVGYVWASQIDSLEDSEARIFFFYYGNKMYWQIESDVEFAEIGKKFRKY